MTENHQPLQDIRDIRKMMEQSSRFISLSGLSGIAAGVCALAGGFAACRYIDFGIPGRYRSRLIFEEIGRQYPEPVSLPYPNYSRVTFLDEVLSSPLFYIAICTFIAAFAGAFFFTWLKSKKQGIPLWGVTSRRLMWNVLIPMITGGIFLYRMAELGNYGLLAPGCLIFYGLALLNASKYTLKEIRWLGFSQIALGILNCWAIGYGLYFWMAGFGVMHIVYGVYMWWRYERETA
jgi:hypothetical protein